MLICNNYERVIIFMSILLLGELASHKKIYIRNKCQWQLRKLSQVKNNDFILCI